jgi:hypothetical protein
MAKVMEVYQPEAIVLQCGELPVQMYMVSYIVRLPAWVVWCISSRAGGACSVQRGTHKPSSVDVYLGEQQVACMGGSTGQAGHCV